MVGYTQITAPFDGVVTHRYADPGALIQAGTASDTQAMPLVRVSDNYLLRLDFPVTVDYVKDVQLGRFGGSARGIAQRQNLHRQNLPFHARRG